MARSHPPTLLKIAERTLRDECDLARGERILVALSGGGDSSALVHVLSLLAPKIGFSLVAHGVDHGLRQEASAELDLAESLCQKLSVPFSRTRVDVGTGGNLQARARAARHEALASAASQTAASRIATAHHADDRAETVIMRLLNGSPPSGLGVLPPAEGRLVRPLVRARKADIEQHLARHGIPHAEDPSNLNRRFLRVRIRLDVMPVLEAISPAVVPHLTTLADEIVSGALPIPTDDAGVPVALRGAHVREVRRALRLGKGARIRISGGREIVVDPKRRELRVDRGTGGNGVRGAHGTSAQNPARGGQKGDAKRPKRG
jgi:tRNA(Ile)-lysidine synthase